MSVYKSHITCNLPTYSAHKVIITCILQHDEKELYDGQLCIRIDHDLLLSTYLAAHIGSPCIFSLGAIVAVERVLLNKTNVLINNITLLRSGLFRNFNSIVMLSYNSRKTSHVI
jgi:hypothetical protein